MGIDAVWRRSPAAAALAGLGAVLVGAAAGALTWWGTTDTEVALVVVLALIAPVPFVVRGIQGRFDLFEPVNVITLCVLVMFVWRPIAELQNDLNPFPGYDARPGFERAMIIGIVGTACVYIGYFAQAGQRLAGRLTPLPDAWDSARSVRFAAILLIIGALITALLIAVVGPAALLSKFGGRTVGQVDLNEASSGYLIQGPYLVIPASLILYIAFHRQRTGLTGVLLAVCVLVALLLTIPSGGRTLSLQILLPLVILWYLRRGRRPRLVTLAAVFVAFLMFANISGALRKTESRAGTSLTTAVYEAASSPDKELNTFITGADPSEFTVAEIQATAHETGQLPFRPGSTLYMLVLGGVPTQLFPGGEKPQTPAEHVTRSLFPTSVAVFTSSAFGAMYADAGWISLSVLSLLFGIGLRALWEYFQRSPTSGGVQLVFAGVMAMLVIVMRNEVLDLFYRGVFMIIPLVVCVWLCAREPVALRDRLRQIGGRSRHGPMRVS